MLFNSVEFILVFFPLTLAGFALLRRVSVQAALAWLIVTSLGFYAWWRPVNVLIIVPAILADFVIARTMLSWRGNPARSKANTALLTLGIVLNVAVLGYFKYTTFFQRALNDLAGTDFTLTYIVLPLGISFITFQKIAFLIDTHAGNVDRFSFREYCLFILFFPQLIAGPIVHFREMMPQFRALGPTLNRELLAAGGALFVIGLFKKVVLADTMAGHVSPIFAQAGTSGGTAMIEAWLASLGFTMQIYFDFSGYSDMAAGLALCMGIRLPLNFDSPLKATNIIDFWNRWHITLTRFLTAYIYNPLALWATRRRLRRGKPGLSPRSFSPGAFLFVLAGPTVFTMFVSGLWHGAGYLFVLWGLLHGFYLVVNHAWRRIGPGRGRPSERYQRWMKPVGFLITFLSVCVAMVIFRAPNLAAAADIVRGMIGLNGLDLPASLVALLGIESLLPSFVGTAPIGLQAIALLAALLGIALLLPNSMQFTARFEPTLGVKRDDTERRLLYRLLDFRPNLAWGFALGLIGASAIVSLGGPTEFLYWQF